MWVSWNWVTRILETELVKSEFDENLKFSIMKLSIMRSWSWISWKWGNEIDESKFQEIEKVKLWIFINSEFEWFHRYIL